MKTVILSDGGWGTALSCVLAANGHEVTMWGPFPDYLAEMAATRRNERFLKGVILPDALRFEPDMTQAVAGCDLAVLATPTQYLRKVLQQLRGCYDAAGRPLLVNVAKGIEETSWLRISEMVAEVMGPVRYAVLSGPSHAEEVSRRVPTAVVAASSVPAEAELVQQTFMNSDFRVYTGSDVVGLELGGALKNVIAIAAGIIDGMKLGDNPKAALMTRGIAEMGRLGEALGGEAQTFSGLSGIGDLIVTCTSGHSRNRHVGEELGRGKELATILREMGMVVAEGVRTTLGAWTLARRTGVKTPIINEIHAVLYEDRKVETALHNLMERDGRSEF